MNQNIQTLLIYISKSLDDQNVKDLVFLCGNKLTATEKQGIADGNALFQCLQKKGLVSQDDLSFLKEILCKIERNDILTDILSMTQRELADLKRSPRHISSYRSLLYDISQGLSKDDVNNVKFYVYPQRAKLQKTDSMLDVLIEMEKDVLVSEKNLEKLKETLAVIDHQDLIQSIESWENQDRQATYLDSTQEKTPVQEKPTNQPEKQEAGSGKDKKLGQYNLDKEPHGWCVILNNEDFEKAGRDKQNKRNLQDRNGTNKDAEAIRRVFERRNYIVKEYKNHTGQEMSAILKKYQKMDHSHKDSFVCFILSHGHRGTVLGIDGAEVLIKELTSLFNGQNCQSLIGKPKIFFIQACQGDEFDQGVPYTEADCASTYKSDGGRIPITADFLTAYASSEDYVSLRNCEGSVYIQKLCEALEDSSLVQEDLKNILTILQKNIGDGHYNVNYVVVKQMPSYKSELRKLLILPPPGHIQSH